ncbi:site-specific integrase [Mycolicibacterium agri]|uniref:Site-specific integrase n=1 Tax=Mycolicibacterium agri TaxID=36811 RepID=A0A2A7MNQ9_MYCAG|nr:site-specific integrase [Mycolicibacterium agri]PEG33314.1 site-specific integrase [Mycolicibacterium agri]GFG50183.1 site-specific integrase [Mycolicibacterium agri]
MSGRRYGEGTIYKRNDGRWAGSAYVKVTGGIQKRLTVYGRTREDAHKKLLALLDKSRSGIALASRQWRVGDYLDYWLPIVKSTRRPLTYIQYESLCRLYIRPRLGTKLLSALSVAELQAYFHHLQQSGVGSRTIQKQRTVLSAMLTHAQREDIVMRNVARLVVLPSFERKEIRPWTENEVGRFLAAATGNRFYEAFLLLALYGLRRGEVLGLRWRDIDLADNVIQVRQQIQSIHGRLSVEPLKTRTSRRALPLLQVVATALKQRYEQTTPPPQPDDLIFRSLTGTPVDPPRLLKTFYRLCEQQQLPRITLHHLRHTTATLLKKLAVPARDAQLILGHSNISTTQEIYQHADIDGQRAALSRLAQLVTEAGSSDNSCQKQLSDNENGPHSGPISTRITSGSSGWDRTSDLRLMSYVRYWFACQITEKYLLVDSHRRQWKMGIAAVKNSCQLPAETRGSW